MKYAHILNYVARTPWAILGDKMAEIVALLAFRASGLEYSDDEIRARIGDPSPPLPARRGNIAVVPLRGVIAHRAGTMDESSGGMSAERFAAMIRQLAVDDTIGTIVLDTDSPGGTITGVPEAAEAVYEARASKRIVAVANSTMASAAYWIASQAHEIVGIPSIFEGRIGAIGVFVCHEDLSAALDKEGVKITLIAAGKHKMGVNPFTALTDEQREEIQATVNAAYDRFVKDVARGRGVSPAAVRSGFGEGRGLSSVDAKAAGLIDRIDTFDATLARLAGRRSSVAVGARAEVDESMRLHAGEEPVSEKPAIPVTSEVVEDLEAATGLAESLLASRMEPDAVESAAGAVAEPEPAAPDPWPALDLRRRALELGV